MELIGWGRNRNERNTSLAPAQEIPNKDIDFENIVMLPPYCRGCFSDFIMNWKLKDPPSSGVKPSFTNICLPVPAGGGRPDCAAAGGVLWGGVWWVQGGKPGLPSHGPQPARPAVQLPHCAHWEPRCEIRHVLTYHEYNVAVQVDVEVTWKVLTDSNFQPTCETEFDLAALKRNGHLPLVCITIPARVQVPRG